MCLFTKNKCYIISRKKIRLKAAVKIEVKDDVASARLWLRVNKINNEVGFFKNMANNPIKSNKWAYYSIEGVIDMDAKDITFGGLASYNGLFYFDDFLLQYEINGIWKDIEINNSSFENKNSTTWKLGVGKKEVIVNHFENKIITYKESIKGENCYLINCSNLFVYGQSKTNGNFYETNKVKLYYEIYGKGEPLLLLHGNGQSIENMNNQIDFFKSKYQVIILDCRGRGNSTDSDETLTYDIQASDINNLLTYLNIDSTNIIGWSDGGIIGLILAKDYPQKVKKIIVSGANVLQDTTVYYYKNLEEFKQIVNDKSTTAFEKKLYSLMINYPNISFKELGKIKCPTMVVAGDNDEIKIEHTVKIFQSIKNAQLFIVPKTSHYVLSENAALFNNVALRFIKE